jgi:hypothetical protein
LAASCKYPIPLLSKTPEPSDKAWTFLEKTTYHYQLNLSTLEQLKTQRMSTLSSKIKNQTKARFMQVNEYHLGHFANKTTIIIFIMNNNINLSQVDRASYQEKFKKVNEKKGSLKFKYLATLLSSQFSLEE